MFNDKFFRCKLFKGIDSNEIRGMMKCLAPRVVEYKEGNFVFIEGDSLEEVGIIVSGEVNILKESYSGDGIVVRKLSDCEMFGEVAVFAERKKWPATVKATKDSTIAFFSANKIKGECPYLCPRHSQFIRNLLSVISLRAAYLSKKMDYFSIKSMKGKIAAYLWDEYTDRGALSFKIKLNRQEMADYLNVSRPSMSRELGRMKAEGVIDFYRSSFKILDEKKLRALALK